MSVRSDFVHNLSVPSDFVHRWLGQRQKNEEVICLFYLLLYFFLGLYLILDRFVAICVSQFLIDAVLIVGRRLIILQIFTLTRSKAGKS